VTDNVIIVEMREPGYLIPRYHLEIDELITGILNFTHMIISSRFIYFTCLFIYKLFSTARSYYLSMIKNTFTPHDNNFYRYNFTHASPILCSKSLHLHFYFLGSHLYKYLRPIVYNNFHKHTLCQQHEAISHYHISHYKFDLTLGTIVT
jgi:hypothetical protein